MACRRTSKGLAAVAFAFGLCLVPSGRVATAADEGVDFGRDIRSLLSDKCFSCHGPDKQRGKHHFRLDTESGAFAALGDRRAIVPGKPDASEVLRRISSSDVDERMPPADSGRTPLTPEQIAKVRRWIEDGAEWREHWAFIPPVRSEFPEGRTFASEQVRALVGDVSNENPIDRFIRAKLSSLGLEPSPEADRRTLLRRVTFDLTGLPPTPDEVRAFVQDSDANAYERVVDRLLDSEAYGEHMARFWLDAVRYGDTHGLHLDNYREMWPYRDWVIRAFNSNMSYAQFATEQLAGDLLAKPRLEQQIASGFNRLHVSTNEGGSIKEEVYVRNVVDRVEATGTIFLGLTLGCCVCHDHKFDPVSQKEFYQLFAFFNSIDANPMDGNRKAHKPVVRVPDPEQAARFETLELRLAELREAVEKPREEFDLAQVSWEASERERLQSHVDWTVLDPREYNSRFEAELEKLGDRSILAGGNNPPTDVYEVVATIPQGGLTAIRLEVLIDGTLPERTSGRSKNGNAILSEIEAELLEGDGARPIPIDLVDAWADGEGYGDDRGALKAIDGDLATGWTSQGHRRRDNRTLIFVAADAFGETEAKDARLRVRLRHESSLPQHQFGRFRLSVTTAEEFPEFGTPDDISKALLASVAQEPVEGETELTEEEQDAAEQRAARLRTFFREKVLGDPDLNELFAVLRKLEGEHKELDEAIPTTLVMKELEEPREAFILVRGAYDAKGDPVERKTPVALPPMDPDLPRDREGLAKWLLDPGHPLTARVAVNRFWQQAFGTGIVKTSEDFGNQGEPPTHPELLDWLAVDFRENGWDIKRLMRQITTSVTYRQSSRMTPEQVEADPENRWLARGPRFRLDAEMLRDQALAVSGGLVREIGGPSVKPPQPEGIWAAVGYTGSNTVKFTPDTGAKIYRRSVYTFWKRTAPPPQMKIFDAPSRESCTVRRERTNTPLQALVLMNEPQYFEAARRLAERTMVEGGETPQERLAWAFELVTARPAAAGELRELVSALEDHHKVYAESPETAKELIQVGASNPSANLDPVEFASYTMAANLILNLDEVVTKE